MSALLEVERIGKSFGGVRALHDISLSVKSGEIVGIMGANGAGKTTLFSIIAGHVKPDSGTVRLDGQPITALRPDAVCRRGIGRTFQIVRPFTGLSLRENLAVAALFGSRRAESQREADRRADEILHAVGLADRASAGADTLTLAGQKKLELARALATGCRLLLLDEVMAGLTPTEVAEMLETLRRLHRERSLTIVIIEHVMGALMRLSHRILVLHHGERIAEGSPAEVARDPRVLACYLGEAA
jgi:branched-chain amino acid transport system ATP-binding protein